MSPAKPPPLATALLNVGKELSTALACMDPQRRPLALAIAATNARDTVIELLRDYYPTLGAVLERPVDPIDEASLIEGFAAEDLSNALDDTLRRKLTEPRVIRLANIPPLRQFNDAGELVASNADEPGED